MLEACIVLTIAALEVDMVEPAGLFIRVSPEELRCKVFCADGRPAPARELGASTKKNPPEFGRIRGPATMIGDYLTGTVRGLPISPTWKTRNLAPLVELMLLATMFRSGSSCSTSPGPMTRAGSPSTSILIEPWIM